MIDEEKKDSDMFTLSLSREQIYAMQIAVADQLTLFQTAINDEDLEPDIKVQAHHLLELYRGILEITDIDGDDLLDQWDQQTALMNKRAEVIDIATARKDKVEDDDSEEL